MKTVTITEALAELRTIDARLEKKRQFVVSYAMRPATLVDPLVKDGGAPEVIRRERQAIYDLETQKIAIRRAIAAANATTEVRVGGVTYTIADWLTWRRDVVPGSQAHLETLRATIDNERRRSQGRGMSIVAAGSESRESDLIVNLSEAGLHAEIEHLQETLGALDGQLSLKNATVTVAY